MAALFYVTCNVRPPEQSLTLSLGHEFLREYLRWNPRDEVQVLDLYRDSIQRIDQDLINAWERIRRNSNCTLFSDDERRKIVRVWRLADQFSVFDKFVFVTHSLNLWFPAEFKMYIDAICVPGRTYRLTPAGAVGMLQDRKKSLHLHACPSFSYGQEQDLSMAYLRSMLNFLGVADQETVLVQGDDPGQGNMEKHEAARSRLLNLARSF